jgi:hypothetical protein
VLAGSVVIAAALGACGGSDDGPSGTPSSSAAAESPSGEESPSGSQVAEINGAQLEVPAGWEVEEAGARVNISAPEDDLGYSPGLAVFNADVTLADTTEDLATSAIDTAQSGAKRLPDVEFGGVTFFHLREGDDTNTFDTYGAVVDGSEVTVAWTFINDMATPKQIDELVNQVMPSFKFEG